MLVDLGMGTADAIDWLGWPPLVHLRRPKPHVVIGANQAVPLGASRQVFGLVRCCRNVAAPFQQPSSLLMFCSSESRLSQALFVVSRVGWVSNRED
jgi:hypothetical protein